MILSALISAFRARASDLRAPYLWGDEEVTLYLNDAVQEAATRARLIKDSSTPSVVQLAIDPIATIFKLHPSILDLERVKLDSQPRPLTRITLDQLDAGSPNWESQKGQPKYFYEDNGAIRLIPQSAAADTLRLVVYRLPVAEMVEPGHAPEIHAQHHLRLLDWALRCAYLKQDTDTLDETKAQKYELMFERSFGVRPDANVQRKQRDDRPTIVRMQQ